MALNFWDVSENVYFIYKKKEKHTEKNSKKSFCRVVVELLVSEVALRWQQIFGISLCFMEEVWLKF